MITAIKIKTEAIKNVNIYSLNVGAKTLFIGVRLCFPKSCEECMGLIYGPVSFTYVSAMDDFQLFFVACVVQ